MGVMSLKGVLFFFRVVSCVIRVTASVN